MPTPTTTMTRSQVIHDPPPEVPESTAPDPPPAASVRPSAAASTAPSQSSCASAGWIRCCSIVASWSWVSGPAESAER